MNNRTAAIVIRTALAALVVAPASATVHTLTATLNGVEEVPPHAVLGLGAATVTLDDVSGLVTVAGNYSGLSSSATLAHVHGVGWVGIQAGILINLTNTGGSSGTIGGGGTLSAANVVNMLNGLTWINVHTTGFTSGEVRGQILSPPLGSSTFCSGDGSLATACPCVPPNTVPAPPAAAGHGCANSFNLNGALLRVHGRTSPDSVKFVIDIGMNYASFGLMLKGTGTDPSGVISGDGVLCVGGALIRFGSHYAGTNGAPFGIWTYPNTVQTIPVSVATAQASGSTSAYQLYFRNALLGFCSSATTNVSSGALIPWP